MKNLNVNLTTEQARLVDDFTTRYGFANRSEFLRAVLRYIFYYSPETIRKLNTATFEQPPTKNIREIINGLAETKQYTKKFLTSVERGLKKSKYFKR